jgi:hypothetical protein
MSEKRLGIKERAALLALMAAAREVSNAELQEITGFSLTGEARRKVNDMKLVESRKSGRTFVHTLTDDGWAWCAKELSASVPKGAGSAGGALYAVLAGLGDYLSRSNLALADIFQAVETKSIDVEALIRDAYKQLRKEPRGWVSLTKLRPLLPGLPREEVDAALHRMNRIKGVNFVPESNQKVLSAEDRRSTVRIGNEDKLLLSIDEP